MNNPDDDAIFEQLAAAIRPAELPAAKRERLRRRVLERARAQAPDGTRTLRADDGEWQSLDDKIRIRVLHRDAATNRQTLLMRVAAGGRMPGHRHTQSEEFLVLEGECHIGTHRLCAGDMHVADAGSWHDDITTETGVLVLVHGEIRMSGHA